ncbi:hypothetical protein D5086_001380 [Populus alba]|uniref:Uncharacterized protein n=1 Tax=Populus alba TaxID=43335 RepID=A0ACC4CZR1_POPAL
MLPPLFQFPMTRKKSSKDTFPFPKVTRLIFHPRKFYLTASTLTFSSPQLPHHHQSRLFFTSVHLLTSRTYLTFSHFSTSSAFPGDEVGDDMDAGAGGGEIPGVGDLGAIGEGGGFELGPGLIEGLPEGGEGIIGGGDETGGTAGEGVMAGGGVDVVGGGAALVAGGVEILAGGIVGGDDVGP